MGTPRHAARYDVPVAIRLVALALALAFVGAGPARAAEVDISWDRDLAFEWDRASYERTLAAVVRTSHDDVAAWLGWPLGRRLGVHVLTRARYEAQFGSDAAWSRGAHYHRGAIYVNGGARLDGAFEGLMVHETAHAFLDHLGTGGRLPTWVNEGIAEKLGLRRRGQERLTTGQVGELEDALEHRRLTPLPARGLGSRFGYLQSFAAVLYLEQRFGKESLLRVVRRTLERGPFEQALDAELRVTVGDLEEGFRAWVDHLQ
jgi:hypothetical protein